MDDKKHYRHELKFGIAFGDYLAMRDRLKRVMTKDPHTSEDGRYRIRSIYFDNSDDKALREKVNGIAKREKFRIRYYNDDFSFITLEKKMKIDDLCLKYDARITEEECRRLLRGELDWMKDCDRPLVRELYVKMRAQGLRPKTIVDYTREPFIFRPGNVRVTFDYDIRTGLDCTDFLDPDAVTVPAGDAPILLEVKWDDYLPSIIRDAVQTPGRRVTAFSKYAQCRIYG